MKCEWIYLCKSSLYSLVGTHPTIILEVQTERVPGRASIGSDVSDTRPHLGGIARVRHGVAVRDSLLIEHEATDRAPTEQHQYRLPVNQGIWLGLSKDMYAFTGASADLLINKYGLDEASVRKVR